MGSVDRNSTRKPRMSATGVAPRMGSVDRNLSGQERLERRRPRSPHGVRG